jgi:anti-anti-sigma regulatory factor
MLKITVQEATNTVTLKIEGRVVDSVIGELDRAWLELYSNLGSRRLLVDLRGVTFLDRSTRNYLATIYAETGAEFLANTPMTKYFAEEATQAALTTSR